MSMPLLQEVSAERYVVESDGQADRAARKALQRRAEKDRRIAHYKKQIQLEEAACAAEESFYLVPLREYLDRIPARETKTLRKYALPSAEMVLTKERLDYDHSDEAAVVRWMEENGYGEYVRVVKKPAWAEFKKLLAIDGGMAVVKETGEVVECVPVFQKAERFDVKELPGGEEG